MVLVATLSALGLGACASRGGMQALQGEVAQSRAQLEELRRLYESSTRELAKTVGELKGLEAQVAKLAQAEAAAGRDLARLEARLAEAEEALRGTRAALDNLSRELVRQATAPASSPKAPEPGPPARQGPAEQLYAAGMASFRAGEHGQAVLQLLDFLARYPRHALAPHAQFWIAEAYFLQRDYRQALVEFQKAAEMNSAGGKAPDALLKVGLCLRALNQPDRARETWERVVEAYPDTEAARQARALLQERPAPASRAR
jgi:tol-pal system protein YbgF